MTLGEINSSEDCFKNCFCSKTVVVKGHQNCDKMRTPVRFLEFQIFRPLGRAFFLPFEWYQFFVLGLMPKSQNAEKTTIYSDIYGTLYKTP